jgi:hypothetical protein
LTPTVIAKEALMQLENHMVMGSKVHRNYEQEFNNPSFNGYKSGDTVTIQKPNKFKSTTGRTRATSTITESSITLQVATQRHVSWSFNSKDLTLDISKYSEKYITPAAIALSNAVDVDCLALYKNIFNDVYESTGFVTPETYMVMAQAGQRLDEEAAPQDDRCIVFNPAAHWSMSNAMKNMYVTRVSEKALTKGYLATIANFDIYMDQNVQTHTTGAFHDTGSTAEPLVATTGGVTGTSIELIHFRVVSTSVLKQGDVFTIADVYAVNPVSGASTGVLRQFVVTGDASAAATATSAILTAFVSPEIIDTGAYKTVDTIPAAGAAVTVLGTQGEPYPENLAFHKNAFALVMVPLEMPSNTWGARESHGGFSIRVVKDYDIDLDDDVIRMDILYGVKTLYPELACRIRGAEG